MTWQPISTAPKDFSEILVVDWDGDVMVACYERHASPPFWSRDVHDLTTNVPRALIEIRPKYWQPLPEPPTE